MPYKHLIAEYIRPMQPVPTELTRTGSLTDKIECILFDVYGTLFISGSGDIHTAKKESRQYHLQKKLLEKYNIDQEPRIAWADFFNQIETAHQAMRERGIDVPEIIIEKIWKNVLGLDLQTAWAFAVEFELIQNQVYPMPRLKQMLHECRELNLLMGLISNAQFFTQYLFEWFLESKLEDLGFWPGITIFS